MADQCSLWLKNCSIHYWGDIDTHGFGILDQLRGHFDHVASFLMDRATLDAHAAVWGSEDKPLRVDLHRLTSEERALYGRSARQPHSGWAAA
ncbi:MAG: Wadjet anti-phage system protein JetD domain-containing protein [Sulfuricella sp.]